MQDKRIERLLARIVELKAWWFIEGYNSEITSMALNGVFELTQGLYPKTDEQFNRRVMEIRRAEALAESQEKELRKHTVAH